MRTFGRSVAVIGLGALVITLGASSALAHATYKSSNPGDESTVSSAPSQITAEFTEPMANGSYMAVTDPCGRDSSSGSSQTGSSMSVGNTSSAAGTYSVFWRAVSIDSHITEGTFTFTATGGDPCPGEEEEEVTGPGGGGGRSGGSGSGGGSGGSGSTSTGGSGAVGDGNGSGSGGGHSDGRHGKHQGPKNGGRDGRSGAGNQGSTGPLAGARTDVPDVPSAIEGIPLDGLLITLAVAALIGAAAGKIYFSLSGDGS